MDIKLKLIEFDMAKVLLAHTTTDIKEFVKSNAPIEDRWTAYLKIEDQLPEDTCYFDLTPAEEDMNCGELSYYDDLNMDRHAVSSLSEIVEKLQRKWRKDFDEDNEFLLFREAIMQSGDGSTENDW